MSPGATFERIYHALKEQLGSGRFDAGVHLEPAALADDLSASITPVRDALHRLAGEGLVEAPRGDGFRTPLVTEFGLRHLYRWNASLLDLAARTPVPRDLPARTEQADLLTLTEFMFRTIASFPGNPEHVAAVVKLSERLRSMRRIEASLIPDLDGEMERLGVAVSAGLGDLRRTLADYHRKRERLVAEIVQRLHGQ